MNELGCEVGKLVREKLSYQASFGNTHAALQLPREVFTAVKHVLASRTDT
jgi:hypothetical protein